MTSATLFALILRRQLRTERCHVMAIDDTPPHWIIVHDDDESAPQPAVDTNKKAVVVPFHRHSRI